MTDANLPPAAANDAHPGTACATALPVQVLNADALAALHQLDPSGANQLVRRVMTTYRSSLARLLAQLTQARGQSDLASLRLATHTLKSSSASVGALTLSALCGAAEQAARDGKLDGLPPLLDQLVAEAARVDVAVVQLLAIPTTPPR